MELQGAVLRFQIPPARRIAEECRRQLVQTDLQLNWRMTIWQHLGLSYKAYNSKYKEAEDSENPRTVAFREKIEELIENFD